VIPNKTSDEFDIPKTFNWWPVAVISLLRMRRVGSEYFHWIGRALAE
jgi:hypothetical protein